MNVRSSCLLFAVTAFLVIGSGSLRAQPANLEAVLEQMEKRGATLKSMNSGLFQKKWTDILEEYDRGESGRFYFLKQGDRVFLRKDITQPQENTLTIADGRVTFYQPRIRQAQFYEMGQHRDRAEFLLLGFGSDKQSMQEAYRIRLAGEEEVGGRKTYVLELTPRSESVSAFFSQIVLWIDSQLWVPVQQKLVEPNRDHLLIRFESIVLNPNLSRGHFEVRLPRDVKRIEH